MPRPKSFNAISNVDRIKICHANAHKQDDDPDRRKCFLPWCKHCKESIREKLIHNFMDQFENKLNPRLKPWAVTVLFQAKRQVINLNEIKEFKINLRKCKFKKAYFTEEIAAKREKAQPHVQLWMKVTGINRYVPHVHGIIWAENNPTEKLKYYYGEKNQVMVKSIFDLEGWLDYIHKHENNINDDYDREIINKKSKYDTFYLDEKLEREFFDVSKTRETAREYTSPLINPINKNEPMTEKDLTKYYEIKKRIEDKKNEEKEKKIYSEDYLKAKERIHKLKEERGLNPEEYIEEPLPNYKDRLREIRDRIRRSREGL